VAQNKRKPFFKSVAKKVKGWFAWVDWVAQQPQL
jgi:hypothetical protein